MRKENRKYYFSVEGETEQWYLKRLQEIINTEQASKYTVKIDSKIYKDPVSRVKDMTVLGKTVITHLFDYESDEPQHVQHFIWTLDRMKEAQDLGKSIEYKSGYSNYTFDLWIILHMSECNGTLIDRQKYLEPINKAFGESFENLKQYKKEDNFKRILKKLTLNHVRNAIQRSKIIMQRNQELDRTLHQYKGFKYYKENPSLLIWETIEQILSDCQLLK